MKHSLVQALFVLTLAPLVACAAPGALEINQDCVAVGCFAGDTAGYPITITQPGSYILTSDLSPPGTGIVSIDVSSVSPIDIDLNGHTINGGGTCTGNPVTACTGSAGAVGISVTNGTSSSVIVHIHNGTIRGFSGGGIQISEADDGTVLEHLTLAQNGSGGAFIDSQHPPATTRIRDLQLVRNGGYGVFGTSILLVENSTAVGNLNYGLEFLGSGSVAVGNRLSSNGLVGLYCGGASEVCALGQNTFVSNNGGGAAAQFTVTTLSNMGGNVCLDHGGSACP